MSGRIVLRVIAGLALVGLAVVIGINVYNAGVTAGLAEAGRNALAAGEPVTYYPGAYIGHGWGGFGVFGIFFWILGVFLIFGLLRAAFGWGRWGRGGRSWSEHGYGHGHRYDGPRDNFEEWHRRAHGEGGSEPEPESGPR